MMARNPDHDFLLYDDHKMNKWISDHCNSDEKNAFNLIKIGAARADFWRYLILLKYGGIYLDIDSFIKGHINCFINHSLDSAVVSRENNPSYFLQWLLVFQKGHPILENTVKMCINNILEEKTNNPFWSTGPGVFSVAVNQYISKYSTVHGNFYSFSDEDIDRVCDFPRESKLRLLGMDFEGNAIFKSKYTQGYLQNQKHWSTHL